jgi:hypothetical protein
MGHIAAQGRPAACPQLAKADFASSSQHVREGQSIAELKAEIDALQRQALALARKPTGDVPLWGFTGGGSTNVRIRRKEPCWR